jgi:predicted acyl esterase
MDPRLGAAVCLLVAATALAGCSSSPPEVPPQPGPADARLDGDGFVREQFSGHRFLEQDLGGGEGTLRLHADIYLPDKPLGAGAPTKFPTILLLSPYWGGGTHDQPVGYMPYDFLVQRLLPRGYAVVFGDLGGNGGSSGCWDFMGPVERQSAYAMVEAIAAQDWSDGQVGMFGLSYDAMTQVMASSDAAPHLVTVVPASGLTEAYKGLKMAGVHYGGGWHSTIGNYEGSSVLGPGPTSDERRAGWVETVQRSPECMAGNEEGDAATGAYTDYYKARDYRGLGSKVKASVFVTQGFLDPAVKPDNLGAWFASVPGEKKAWLGFWYHQYPTARNAGRTDLYLTFHRWFDHALLGVANGIDSGPAFDVQDSQGRWRHEDSWPPADAGLTVYAAGYDRLAAPGDQAQAGVVYFGGPGGAVDLATGNGFGSAVLESAPLAADLHIAGAPAFNATFVPTGSTGYVLARLFDDDRMVSQGVVNGLFADGLDAPKPMAAGQPVHLRLAMYPTDWVVPAGHRIRLTLATADGQGWFDSDPTLARFALQAGPDARLELPSVERDGAGVFLTSCGMALKDDVPGCFHDLEDQGVKSH